MGPQVINLNLQKALAFPGQNVIDDLTDKELGAELGETSWDIDLKLKDLYSLSATQTITDKVINYDSETDYWYLQLDGEIQDVLVDRSKWVAQIIHNNTSGTNPSLRSFKLLEFMIDSDSLRDVTKDLPFDYKIDTTPGSESSYICWYTSDANIGQIESIVYRAPVYMGGSGTNFATKPELVTHRGGIATYTPPAPPPA
jgi:hypothetical protein